VAGPPLPIAAKSTGSGMRVRGKADAVQVPVQRTGAADRS
jgi:hypothetical protein